MKIPHAFHHTPKLLYLRPGLPPTGILRTDFCKHICFGKSTEMRTQEIYQTGGLTKGAIHSGQITQPATCAGLSTSSGGSAGVLE